MQSDYYAPTPGDDQFVRDVWVYLLTLRRLPGLETKARVEAALAAGTIKVGDRPKAAPLKLKEAS